MVDNCLEMEEHVSVEPKSPNILIPTLIVAVFLIGIAGNSAALCILYKSAKSRNRKHVLMLRCLATNDLIAEVGMLLVMILQTFKLIPMHCICIGYVLLRAFGLGSGVVAFVMALERWLALTRPFLYQQIVTYRILKRFILCLWCGGALLTYLPLFGFGLYYSEDNNGTVSCKRYRDADETTGKIYAYIYLIVENGKEDARLARIYDDVDSDEIPTISVIADGTTLCMCIAVCNLTVIWELSRIRSQGRILVRRVSRSTINNRVKCAVRYQTPEEVAFAKLMAIICIIFVVCWAPQMISIPMAQFNRKSKFYKLLSIMANTLMCTYFTLDPYVYVLQRYMEKSETILPCCFCKRSTASIPTTTTTPGTPTSVLLHPPSFTTQTVM